MTGFTLAREARADIRAIRGFLESESLIAWPIVIERLHAALRLIGRNPHIGRKRPEVTRRPYRFYLVRPYIVVYDPRTKPITVAAVLHGAQSLKKRLRERERHA